MRSKITGLSGWRSLAVLLMLLAGMLVACPVSPLQAATGADGHLRVTVDGTRVTFDWSAMPAASQYWLAVAPYGVDGKIDMTAMSLLPMGRQHSFTSTGLPSGEFFQALVLADTVSGLVASNLVQFMPFAGTVTFPAGTGGILMEAHDPGGMGDMIVYGNVNGDQVMVTRVVVDDGSGEGLLTFVDNHLDTFTHGGLTLKFVYAADGSVSLESAQSVSRAASDDCQEAVKKEIKNVIRDYDKNNTKIRAAVKWLLVGRGVGVYIHSPLRFAQELILSGAADSVYMAALEERSRLEQKMEELAQQYEDCNKNPDPVDPDPDPSDGSTITIDDTCEVPAGAELHEFMSDNNAERYYVLDGHRVGPEWLWWNYNSDELWLWKKSCYNAAGQLHGWQINYYENGNMQLAIPYSNGVKNGHQYDFYEDGGVHVDNTLVNGTNTYRVIYYEDGSLKGTCSPGKDGQLWCHWE